MNATLYLQRVREVIDSPEKWCRHGPTLDEDGKVVGLRSKRAVRRSLQGAFDSLPPWYSRYAGSRRASPHAAKAAEKALEAAIWEKAKTSTVWFVWSEKQGRTYEEVMAVLDLAIEYTRTQTPVEA